MSLRGGLVTRRWATLLGGTQRQLSLIVIGSIVLSHLTSAAIWIGMNWAPALPDGMTVDATRLAIALRLVEQTAASDREAVLARLERLGTSMTIVAGPAPVVVPSDDRHAAALREAVDVSLGDHAAQVRIGRLDAPDDPERAVVAVAPLDGQRWLIANPRRGRAGREIGRGWLTAIAGVLFVVIPLAAMSLWAARRLTRPLTRLAVATARQSDIRSPMPVAEEGTREVQQVARAFNEMSGRLRQFVIDRTRMLAAVSHDLRTPLTRLRLRVETSADAIQRDRSLNDIRTMETMISSALAFIREEQSQEPFQRVDLAVLLQTSCDEFADSGHDVSYDGAIHMAIMCRPQAIGRAFDNVIDNAVKFGGRAVVRLATDGSDAVIRVEDDGPGLPEAMKAELFKPFVRGDASRNTPTHGSGLGLAIAKAVIDAHGGSIRLMDREPHGLSVRITIPARRPVLATPL